ncbi:ribonuclease H2, subunit B [Rhodocollybia butyracea]|uniref:Ribonuclease H2 subunit B n=1 Tax=Rhodocollybia butyracea TaxID=206335 RepID=A0A9P5UDR5_9AGAR|nr:ribonuclease H2, subunit B [Rhodocollybia butyracea]
MSVRIGILPDDVIDSIQTGVAQRLNSGTFIRLTHPRTGLPALFLPHQTGSSSAIHELQAVEPVNARSWFIANEIASDGRLLMIMPIDPAFLLIPILRAFSPKDGSLGQFRTSDDIFEEAASKMEQSDAEAVLVKDVAIFASLDCCKDSLSRICDTQEIPPDITVYRFSPTKLTNYLKLKVENLVSSGVIDSSRSLVRSLAKNGLMEDGHEKLLESGRIKAACELVAQYLPLDIRNMLMASYDFSDLDVYINKLEEDKRLHAQQTAPKNGKSRAKVVAKDASTEKVDKRKASKASQGVEKLKKANINGMSKLSTFFMKKT